MDLKRHGRWASDSSAQRYVDQASKRTSEVPAALAKATVASEVASTREFTDGRKRQRCDEGRILVKTEPKDIQSQRQDGIRVQTKKKPASQSGQRVVINKKIGVRIAARPATVKARPATASSAAARKSEPKTTGSGQTEYEDKPPNIKASRSLLPEFNRMPVPVYCSEFSRVPSFTPARVILARRIQTQEAAQEVTESEAGGGHTLSPTTLQKLFSEDAFQFQ